MHSRTLAKECWLKAGGDIDKAVTLMVHAIKSDIAILDEFLEIAVRREIQARMEVDRGSYWEFPPINPGQNLLERDNKAKAIRDDFLNYPMRNGVPLSKATAIQLRQEKNFFLGLSIRFAARYRWFDLIEKGLPDERTTVGKHYTNKKLAALHQKAQKHINNRKEKAACAE